MDASPASSKRRSLADEVADESPVEIESEEAVKVPRARSLAHHYFANDKAVLVSFDMETAGEHVGPVQISAEICRLHLVSHGTSFQKDEKGIVSRVYVLEGGL